MLAGSSKYDLFKKFVWELVEPAFHHFTVTDKPSESHFEKLTRNVVINWACAVDAEECLTQTSSQLAEVISNKTEDINPNLKSVVYCNGLRNAERNSFLFIWDRMQRSQDPAERTLITNALGCSQDAELLNLFLETSLDASGETNYRGQERSRVFSAVYSGGKVGLETAMRFLDKNAAAIDKMYNGGSFGGRAIGSAVTGMARRIVNKEQADEFEVLITKLAAGNHLNSGEVSTAKELIQENILWTTKNYDVIENWLEANMKSAANKLSILVVTLVASMLVSFFR